jgi:uncharacterized protein YndB with AHSA1/START domain
MIDVDHQINAVRRRVGHRVLEPGEARTVTLSRTYDVAIDDLWDACTNPERIPRWFLPVTGELRVGGRYQLEGNAGGTVESCDPPRRFTATWEFGGSTSWIAVTLAEEADGRTSFELEHTAAVDDHWEQFGPGAVGVGWDLALIGLDLHLASGASVDPPTFMAWSTSDDGRRFVDLSSRGWCDANIADGALEADARAQADRTTGAYTGT